jgi:hypothetical protein
MNTLTANIQRKWLARIIDGSKTIEYRDATKFWWNKVKRAGPPPFQLRLINGMRPDSPEATVLVDKVESDELAGQLRFHIAKVLSTIRWDKSWHAMYPPLPPEPPFNPSTLVDQKLPLVKAAIQVPQEVLDSVQTPGLHQFTLPVDPKVLERLVAQEPGPLRVRLSAAGPTREVIVYELLSEPFGETLSFSVLSIPPSSASATA